MSKHRRDKLGTLPSLGLSIVGSLAICILAVYAAMTLLNPGHDGARDLKCAMQMQWIVQGLLQYAAAHDGALPAADEDWVALLTDDDPAKQEMFLSPGTWELDRSSYFYVPAARLDPSGTRVLLYEMAGLHGKEGIHIAYHDGRVVVIPTVDAENIIASIDLSQGQPTRPLLKPD